MSSSAETKTPHPGGRWWVHADHKHTDPMLVETSRLMIKIIEYHPVTAILSDQKKVHMLLIAPIARQLTSLGLVLCPVLSVSSTYSSIHPFLPNTNTEALLCASMNLGAWQRTRDLTSESWHSREKKCLTLWLLKSKYSFFFLVKLNNLYSISLN